MRSSHVVVAVVGLFGGSLVSACGSTPPVERPAVSSVTVAPPASSSSAKPAEPSASGPVVLTFAEIDTDWAQRNLPVGSAAAKEWLADPKNAALAIPAVRHILIKQANDEPAALAAAKKKALLVLARLKRGEDFAKLAHELSDDPGSKDKGGRYPGEMVEQFIQPFRDAYDVLAAGEMTKQPVQTQFGWHIIKKDAVDDEALQAGYRHAKALDTAHAVADDVAARLKASPDVHLEQVLEASALALHGNPAKKDIPLVRRVLGDKVEVPPPTQVCAQLLALPRGAISVIPLARGQGFLVGQASTRADGEIDEPSGVCGEALTAAQVRRLIEAAQKKQQKKP